MELFKQAILRFRYFLRSFKDDKIAFIEGYNSCITGIRKYSFGPYDDKKKKAFNSGSNCARNDKKSGMGRKIALMRLTGIKLEDFIYGLGRSNFNLEDDEDD